MVYFSNALHASNIITVVHTNIVRTKNVLTGDSSFSKLLGLHSGLHWQVMDGLPLGVKKTYACVESARAMLIMVKGRQ